MKNFSSITKDELYDLYVTKHMRLADICKIYGMWKTTIVSQKLKEFGITVRKRGYGFLVAPEIELCDHEFEFFDGLMASDGSIARRKNSERYKNDFLSCGFKYKEFAQYVVDKLGLGVKVKPYTHKSKRYKTGSCTQYKFLSKPNTFYTKERDRWYPNGKKVIPEDCRFTPISMNIWYLGDGHLAKNTIYLCTNSFKKDNIENTIIRFLKSIGINDCWVTSRRETCISSRYVKDFLNYIGPCPIECYKYKWDIDEEIIKSKLPEKEILYDLYINKRLSTRKIGDKFGVSYNAINGYLRKYGIPLRTSGPSTK